MNVEVIDLKRGACHQRGQMIINLRTLYPDGWKTVQRTRCICDFH